jgi:hypothetical protein
MLAEKPRLVASTSRPGRFQNKCEMKLPWTDPRFRELVALALLAAFGCGLALSQDDLLFAAIFGARMLRMLDQIYTVSPLQ